ncbi:30S ribosomal protein S2 [Patescibacteria group bacterium]|nr:30S ribosomal protein S2 [Patescibacteria group bacterium]MBU4000179.1 30S ribosomal protein S2 [Patescibacteria group bacterium]MBU4056422.1 30S ribosomal protein S2 [Patescibacteria group bacterium]MBU4368681.1 30S ribosomal protein S2 [Patescibacteria group bacterium]
MEDAIINKEKNLMEMLKAGVHFGHKTTKWNPKMSPYIFGVRNGVHIIDLEQTIGGLNSALAFVNKIATSGGVMVFIGTKKQVKGLIKESAAKIGMPYVAERWIGGLFTNFEVISKQIKLLDQLEKDRDTGKLDKYTKKEQLNLIRKIRKLIQKFGGIRTLKKMPEAVFVADVNVDRIAVEESRKKNIPVVAIVDTDTDPTLATYPIPANDDAISSVKLIVGKLVEEFGKGKTAKNQE